MVNLFMKTLNISWSQCLHWFGEGNFQTLDMPDVMTSDNKVQLTIIEIKTFDIYLFYNFKTDITHSLIQPYC